MNTKCNRPYLPDCNCHIKREDERCPIHAPGARRREVVRALRACQRGQLSLKKYEQWLAKYRRPAVSPYGAIKEKV